MSAVLDAALGYAARGLRVLPLHGIADGRCTCRRTCGSAGKHPLTRGGVTDATTDRAAISRWFMRWPDANVGIATGPASGVTVLDVDPRSGGVESYRELRARGIPESWISITGSGGWHVYFRGDPSVAGNKVGLAPGVDVKDAGGYVVAPPSVHASGREYQWLVEPGSIDLAAQPKWLIGLRRPKRVDPAGELLRPTPIRPKDRSEIIRRARAYASRLPAAVAGQGGSAQAMRVCAQVAQGFGLSVGEAVEALGTWNQDCVPPWDLEAEKGPDSLRRLIRKAIERDTRAGGFLLKDRAA